MRQRLRHSQSSQSDEYLKTCLKDQGSGGGSARVCIGECLCVSCQMPVYMSRVYVEGYLISFVCASIHTIYMDINVCICLDVYLS